MYFLSTWQYVFFLSLSVFYLQFIVISSIALWGTMRETVGTDAHGMIPYSLPIEN